MNTNASQEIEPARCCRRRIEPWPRVRGRAFARGISNEDAAHIIRVAGVVLRVRQLTGTDLPAIERHLLCLRPSDRQARFLGNRADEMIRAYAHELDPSRVILVGAFDPSRRLVGLAEAHPADTTAEVAVSIDPAFRRRGLGRSLVWHALALAFEHSVQAAEFVFSPDNREIVRLVQTLGGRSMTSGRMSVSLSADGAARGMRLKRVARDAATLRQSSRDA